jgi:hypothetical protein
MTKTTADFRPSLEALKAQEDAFVAHAEGNGVTGKAWEVMFALRHAAEFLDHAAEMMADGLEIGDPEVMKRIDWARSKIVEATASVEGACTAH